MKSLTSIGLFLFIVYIFGNLSIAVAEEEKWTGLDEAIVKKIAKEHGREAHEPIINTDQGDLLLFVFLLAGAAGGFLAGYSWKNLMVNKKSCQNVQKETLQSNTSK